MRLKINGEIKSLDLNPANLLNLINRMGQDPRTVVIEFNGFIIKPEQWEHQNLKDGDTIELVTIVGGGS